MHTTGTVAKRYALVFLIAMALPAWIWLPAGDTQIGGAPLSLRVLGLFSVILGPLYQIYFDLRHNQAVDALPWIAILLADICALAYGLYAAHSRPARLVGYLGVFVWVLLGFAVSMSGL